MKHLFLILCVLTLSGCSKVNDSTVRSVVEKTWGCETYEWKALDIRKSGTGKLSEQRSDVVPAFLYDFEVICLSSAFGDPYEESRTGSVLLLVDERSNNSMVSMFVGDSRESEITDAVESNKIKWK